MTHTASFVSLEEDTIHFCTGFYHIQECTATTLILSLYTLGTYVYLYVTANELGLGLFSGKKANWWERPERNVECKILLISRRAWTSLNTS